MHDKVLLIDPGKVRLLRSEEYAERENSEEMTAWEGCLRMVWHLSGKERSGGISGCTAVARAMHDYESAKTSGKRIICPLRISQRCKERSKLQQPRDTMAVYLTVNEHTRTDEDGGCALKVVGIHRMPSHQWKASLCVTQLPLTSYNINSSATYVPSRARKSSNCRPDEVVYMSYGERPAPRDETNAFTSVNPQPVSEGGYCSTIQTHRTTDSIHNSECLDRLSNFR